MKPMLCAFLFLLPYGSLCEPVWAENWVEQPVAGRMAHCYTQMQDAMRAMDPYRARQFAPFYLGTPPPSKTSGMRWEVFYEDFEKATKAIALWDAAKACWTTAIPLTIPREDQR